MSGSKLYLDRPWEPNDPSHPEGFTTIHVEASKEALAPIYAGLATKYNLEIIKP